MHKNIIRSCKMQINLNKFHSCTRGARSRFVATTTTTTTHHRRRDANILHNKFTFSKHTTSILQFYFILYDFSMYNINKHRHTHTHKADVSARGLNAHAILAYRMKRMRLVARYLSNIQKPKSTTGRY